MKTTMKKTLNFKEDTYMKEQRDHNSVPIPQKAALTIREAAEYSNIGINKIDSLLRKPNCSFALYVGTKKLVKRKEFEEFLSRQLSI